MQEKTAPGQGSGQQENTGHNLLPSNRNRPCPVCGRTKDGDCRISASLVLCHYGSTHHPPAGKKPGDVIPGHDGRRWAFTGDTSDGMKATYTLDKPRDGRPTPTEPPTKQWDHCWRYSDTFCVVRRDAQNGKEKQIRPLSWDGARWLWRRPTGLLPLLSLEEIKARPDAPVLVVEGEKTHDAAAKLLPSCVVTTWHGGSSSPHKANWAPLAGRRVTLWPDNDDAGRKAMDRVAALLRDAGAASVQLIANPPDAPAGWDLADASWTPAEAAAWMQGNSSQAAATGSDTKPAEPGSGIAITLRPSQVMTLLPKQMGAIRLNVRSGDAHTDRGILTANDAGLLYLQLSSAAESWPKDQTADAVKLLAQQNQFDPVADYLSGINAEPLSTEQWQRLDLHLLGIDDPIAAEFLPRFFISAVARVFQPGCDVRQSPVLVGPQWRGKTALGRILFGAENWISGVGDLGKDALLRLHTAWCVELAELDGVTRRSDQESLKAFLTETVDVIRRPYDRAPAKNPRRFVFWGTANGAALRDRTGSTRFVTIAIPDQMLPLEWAEHHRDSLWARALEQYNAGVQWNHCSEAVRNAIADRNANFSESDPWDDRIAQALKRKELELQLPVTVADLLQVVEVPIGQQRQAEGQRVRLIAEALGWQMDRRRTANGRKRGLWPQRPQRGHNDGHNEEASDANGSDRLATLATTNLEKLDSKGTEHSTTAEQQQHAQTRHQESFEAIVVATPQNPPEHSGGNGSRTNAVVATVVAVVPTPAWHARAAELHATGMHPHTIAGLLQQELGVHLTGAAVKAALEKPG